VKLLLDTHAFLWLLAGDRRFGAKARRRIEDSRNDKHLSIASIWEMAIKIGLGKLRFGDPLSDLIDRGAKQNAIALIAIEKEHVLDVSALPTTQHGDPFDRLLVAQAMREGMTLVSRDPVFDAYPVRRVW
jgi:PIN domain nuclease of toxin-antitoxin system